MKRQLSNLLTLAALVVAAVFYISGLIPQHGAISAYASSHPYRAALICLALYCLKCLVPLLPTGALYMLCGYMFTPPVALFLCTVGNTICFGAAYYEGARSGAKNPVLLSAISTNGKHGFFPAFFLHCIRFFPCYAAGVYLGAAHLPFGEYLLGSLLGALPTVLLSLSLCSALPHPSPQACVAFGTVIMTTFLCFLFIKHRKK